MRHEPYKPRRKKIVRNLIFPRQGQVGAIFKAPLQLGDLGVPLSLVL
jgi:hypothetical protein